MAFSMTLTATKSSSLFQVTCFFFWYGVDGVDFFFKRPLLAPGSASEATIPPEAGDGAEDAFAAALSLEPLVKEANTEAKPPDLLEEVDDPWPEAPAPEPPPLPILRDLRAPPLLPPFESKEVKVGFGSVAFDGPGLGFSSAVEAEAEAEGGVTLRLLRLSEQGKGSTDARKVLSSKLCERTVIRRRVDLPLRSVLLCLLSRLASVKQTSPILDELIGDVPAS